MNWKRLLRENALIIDFFETLVIMLVAFGVGLSGDQQNYIVAAIVAVVGVIKGFTTRPFPVTVITDAARALLVLAASFGIGLTADQIAVTVTALGTLVTIVARAQITPVQDPVVELGGAGAGPVAGQTNGE